MNCNGCSHGDCYTNYRDNRKKYLKVCQHCRRNHWDVKSDYHEPQQKQLK